jgi:2-oxoglutarate dehydrogenase complex dehydrogenase (E1) component-like enzyme
MNETFAPLETKYAGRISSASTAVGYMSLHLEQEARLVKEAFEM